MRTGQERLDEARALLEEARVVWNQLETTYGQPFDAYLRYYLGSTALVQGDMETARGYLESSLRDIEAAGDNLARGVVLASLGLLAAGLGEVAAGHGQPHRAGQLFGAGQALLPATHPLLRVRVPYDLPAKLAAARAAADPVAFDRGIAEGQAWTIDRAVAAGLASAADPDTDLE